MARFIDLEVFELVGERVELIINPHSTFEKRLKFLRNMDGIISKYAKLEGEIHPVRCGYDNEDNFYISPYGGPKLTVNNFLPNRLGYIIKNIIFKAGDEETYEGYILELEKKDDLPSVESEDVISDGWDNEFEQGGSFAEIAGMEKISI